MVRKGMEYVGGKSWRCVSCDALVNADCECCEPPRCQCKKITDFHKGQTVVLAESVRHPEFRGLRGTVKRTVKSRNVVTVAVVVNGFNQTYDAMPTNVIAAT